MMVFQTDASLRRAVPFVSQYFETRCFGSQLLNRSVIRSLVDQKAAHVTDGSPDTTKSNDQSGRWSVWAGNFFCSRADKLISRS
jgi:hypothetical protein